MQAINGISLGDLNSQVLRLLMSTNVFMWHCFSIGLIRSYKSLY